ncbi:MAG: MlaD family protein [Herbaspirillum sp.]
MENKSHALIAGLFTILLVAAAILLSMWFNRDRVVRIPYELATKISVPGLNPQATVRYRGLTIGKVDDIIFDPKVPGQILIHISVNPDTPITQSTYAMLGYQGVTGIAYIQLDDDGTKPTRVSSSKNKLARIEMRASLFDSLQTKGLSILTETEQLTRSFNQLLSPENQQTIVTAFTNVSRAANDLGAIPKQLQPTLAQLPALSKQLDQTLAAVSTLAQDVSRLSTNLNTLTSALQAPNGTLADLSQTINQVGTTADRFAYDTLPRFNALSSDARNSMRNLNQKVDQFTRRPQSILFGAPQPQPGPGEAGFVAPAK